MSAVWPLCEGVMSDHCLFLFISILKIISGQQGILSIHNKVCTCACKV